MTTLGPTPRHDRLRREMEWLKWKRRRLEDTISSIHADRDDFVEWTTDRVESLRVAVASLTRNLDLALVDYDRYD